MTEETSGIISRHRTEVEMNLNWAHNNPALLVARIDRFQLDHPSTHWDHSVDLSRRHYITLIAIRKASVSLMKQRSIELDDEEIRILERLCNDELKRLRFVKNGVESRLKLRLITLADKLSLI